MLFKQTEESKGSFANTVDTDSSYYKSCQDLKEGRINTPNIIKTRENYHILSRQLTAHFPCKPHKLPQQSQTQTIGDSNANTVKTPSFPKHQSKHHHMQDRKMKKLSYDLHKLEKAHTQTLSHMHPQHTKHPHVVEKENPHTANPASNSTLSPNALLHLSTHINTNTSKNTHTNTPPMVACASTHKITTSTSQIPHLSHSSLPPNITTNIHNIINTESASQLPSTPNPLIIPNILNLPNPTYPNKAFSAASAGNTGNPGPRVRSQRSYSKNNIVPNLSLHPSPQKKYSSGPIIQRDRDRNHDKRAATGLAHPYNALHSAGFAVNRKVSGFHAIPALHPNQHRINSNVPPKINNSNIPSRTFGNTLKPHPPPRTKGSSTNVGKQKVLGKGIDLGLIVSSPQNKEGFPAVSQSPIGINVKRLEWNQKMKTKTSGSNRNNVGLKSNKSFNTAEKNDKMKDKKNEGRKTPRRKKSLHVKKTKHIYL